MSSSLSSPVSVAIVRPIPGVRSQLAYDDCTFRINCDEDSRRRYARIRYGYENREVNTRAAAVSAPDVTVPHSAVLYRGAHLSALWSPAVYSRTSLDDEISRSRRGPARILARPVQCSTAGRGGTWIHGMERGAGSRGFRPNLPSDVTSVLTEPGASVCKCADGDALDLWSRESSVRIIKALGLKPRRTIRVGFGLRGAGPAWIAWLCQSASR